MQKIIADVVASMSNSLDKDQLEKLKFVLTKILYDYDFIEKTTDLAIDCNTINDNLLKKYFAWKITEGSSPKTLKQYKFVIDKFLEATRKPIPDITEDDIFLYLSLKKQDGISSNYLKNIRQTLSSLFVWLFKKGLIVSNPINGIGSIKTEKTIKKPFTEIELEKLRRNTNNLRDAAIVETLYATGARVSELSSLNISSIDFVNKTATIIGKGNKERRIFLTDTSIYYLKQYLDSRTDNNEALFIGLKGKSKRLDYSAIERMLRVLGKKCGVDKVHPHRFRRTLATNLLKKGMSIEEVSAILGHEKLDTTMIYCNISQDVLRNQYMRIMCA